MKKNMLAGLVAVFLFSGSIAFASSYLNASAKFSLSSGTDTGTDPDDDDGTDIEARRYWKNKGPEICSYWEWVPKPGGGMEQVQRWGIQDICIKVRPVNYCVPIECGQGTDTGF